MNVSEIMTTDAATCRTGDSLNRAAQIMWDGRCGCVPILSQDGRVAGIVTDRDVAMAAYTQGRRLDDIAVDTAMSRPAWTCVETTTVEEAEDLMMANAVRRLVVVNGDQQPRGIVSLDDIARHAGAWDGGHDIDLERIALVLGEISRRTTTTEDDGPATRSESDLADLVTNSLAALEALRDEIRVDLELASKDVRDRWRRLEARLGAAELRARTARRQGAGSLAALVESAKEFRRGLRKKPATVGRAAR